MPLVASAAVCSSYALCRSMLPHHHMTWARAAVLGSSGGLEGGEAYRAQLCEEKKHGVRGNSCKAHYNHWYNGHGVSVWMYYSRACSVSIRWPMACETHVLGCTGDKALVLWFAPTQRWTGTKHGCACAARYRLHTYDTHQQPVLESGHRPRLESGHSAAAQHAALCPETQPRIKVWKTVRESWPRK